MGVEFENAGGVEGIGEVAVDDGEVGFADAAGGEKGLQMGGGFGVAGDKAKAGSFAVEAVDEERVWDIVVAFEQRPEGVVEVTSGGMDGKIAGFVNDKEAGRVEEDFYLRVNGRFGNVGSIVAKRHACHEKMVGFNVKAIDAHTTGADAFEPCVACVVGETPCEKIKERDVGVGGRNTASGVAEHG